jgi:hypothetical protein
MIINRSSATITMPAVFQSCSRKVLRTALLKLTSRKAELFAELEPKRDSI